MNSAAHILASLFIGLQFTHDPLLLGLAVVAGFLPDFDHLAHVPRALRTGRFGSASRSRFHELYGLTLFAAMTLFAGSYFPLVFFPLLAHYLLDYLSRPTRPLYPFEGAEIHLELYPTSLSWMTITEVPLTCLLALLTYLSW